MEREDETLPESRAESFLPAAGPAQPRVRAMPRRQLGQAARRQHDPAGASDGISDLPPRVAGHGLAAAPAAELLYRRARRALRVRLAGIREPRALPDVARARDAFGNPGSPALKTPFSQMIAVISSAGVT